LGEEKINGSSCHHIQVNRKPENDSLEPMKELRIEFQYWIKKKDLIPLQYSITMDLALDGDTMCQHEKYVLHKYDINNLKDQSYLTLNSIPKGYKVKDYEPYERPELLDSATIAPNWELLSLKDEKVSLSSLKGQLVLIDFFYKSCYPCMLAIPGLQALHEKYQDKGLRVIGIDPYDTKEEDDIEAFLAKRGVTYTILIGGKDAAKEYHVSAYPTLYLVDETGNIIHIQEGYSKEAEEELEEIIKKHLKTTTNR
jgi:thiol-disulfide isomerase/thioredoxin